MTRPTFEMDNEQIIKNMKLLKMATEDERVWSIINEAVTEIRRLP